jgi:F-type H+-transporting ATPase subunit delta
LSTNAISIRYAKALLALGVEQGAVESFSEQLDWILSAFRAEDFLRLILESPTFPIDKKQALFADLATALELSESMKQFVALLLDKGRIAHLKDIATSYRALADNEMGVVRATITAAAKPLKKQIDAIQQALEKVTGKTVALSVDADPVLLGGLKAEMAGKVFDGSIRAQLQRMAETLQKG